MSEIHKFDRLEAKEKTSSPRIFKTPQEKKRLSYANDCRSSYGESDKGSRKSIRRNKANSNRRLRRAVVQALQIETVKSDLVERDLPQETVRKFTRIKWRKCPDRPLGEAVKDTVESRGRTFKAKIKRRIKASYTYREK